MSEDQSDQSIFLLGQKITAKKVKIFISSLVIGLPLMVGFQNCAKTQQFQTTDVAAFKQSGLSSEDLPVNQNSVVDQPGAPLPPSSSMPPSDGGMVSPPSDPPMVSDPPMASEPPASAPPSPPPADEPMPPKPSDPPPVVSQPPPVVSDPPASSPPSMGEPPPQMVSGSGGEDDDDEISEKDLDDAKAACADLKESHNANSGASFSNDSCSGLQGKKVLSPADFGNNSHIRSVSDVHGKLILCNLEVDELSDCHGSVILVNSKINSIVRCHMKAHVMKSEEEHSEGKRKKGGDH